MRSCSCLWVLGAGFVDTFSRKLWWFVPASCPVDQGLSCGRCRHTSPGRRAQGEWGSFLLPRFVFWWLILKGQFWCRPAPPRLGGVQGWSPVSFSEGPVLSEKGAFLPAALLEGLCPFFLAARPCPAEHPVCTQLGHDILLHAVPVVPSEPLARHSWPRPRRLRDAEQTGSGDVQAAESPPGASGD